MREVSERYPVRGSPALTTEQLAQLRPFVMDDALIRGKHEFPNMIKQEDVDKKMKQKMEYNIATFGTTLLKDYPPADIKTAQDFWLEQAAWEHGANR